MKVFWSYCDRCGVFCPLPLSMRIATCHQCTVGERDAARLLTTAELRFAYEWRRLEAAVTW